MNRNHPQILRVNSRHPEKDVISHAAETLCKGDLVIFPTETVYGVGAHMNVAGAMEKLYSAKERDRNKPIPILIDGAGRVTEFGVDLSGIARQLADRFWPGPMTLVLKTQDGFEGFRVPDHAVAIELLQSVGGALRVTSANRSGDRPALTAEEAVQSLRDSVALVLDSGRSPGGEPSTVVLVDNEELKVIRCGAIGEEEIRG